MRKEAAIIVNPASGNARARSRARHIMFRMAQLGVRVSLFETTAAGDGRRIAAEVCNDFEVITSVGGDGTLNEVINGVVDVGSETPIVVIPTGTANVVSRELGLPEGNSELAEVAVNGKVRALDLGTAQRLGSGGHPEGELRRFAMCAGAGFDAAIVDTVSRERTSSGISMLTYYIPTITTLMNYGFPEMRVYIDGELVDEKSTFTVIGNMRRYGGPFQLFNKATPDDGMLDVCCLHGKSQLDLLRYGLGTLQKKLPDCSGVHYHQARHVLLESDEDVLVQIDGDCGGRLPMRFEVLPGAVNFCVSDLNPHGESAG